METISCGGSSWMGMPFQRISPWRGLLMPQTVIRVVDLPAPLAPIRVTISPSFTRRETSRKA